MTNQVPSKGQGACRQDLRKQVAVIVECDVVLVAEPHGDDPQTVALEIGAGDPAAGGPQRDPAAAGIVQSRQQLILPPIGVGVTAVVARHLRVVAAAEIERLAVGADRQGVRAVLAAAFDDAQLFNGVKLIVAVAVAQSVDSRRKRPDLSVEHHVQLAAVKRHALSHPHADRHSLDASLRDRLADRRRRHAIESAVLIRNVKPTAIVERQRDPRALVWRHFVDQLRAKSRRQLRLADRRPVDQRRYREREQQWDA